MKAIQAALVLGLLAGCATAPPHYVAKGFAPPKSVAVLPFNNHTTDLEGPQFVRERLNDRLRRDKLYPVYKLESVDEKLRELGITDGGQLPSKTPQQLGEALGAEALVYGDLLEYGYVTVGFVNTRKVKARLWMVRSADGERLWEAEAESAEGEGAHFLLRLPRHEREEGP